jgi:hypothetical protein
VDRSSSPSQSYDSSHPHIEHEGVSVRKVVSTLTSTSAEVYLSMAGDKQLGDTWFILVPAGAVRPTGVCSGHCVALHHGAHGGELPARWERRRSLQVPEV